MSIRAPILGPALAAVGGALLVGLGPALWNSIFTRQSPIEYAVIVYSSAEKNPTVARATITLSIASQPTESHLTSPEGVATFILPASIGQQKGALTVERDGFRASKRNFMIPVSSAKEAIYIEPVSPPKTFATEAKRAVDRAAVSRSLGEPLQPTVISRVFSSDPKSSGLGADYSRWYELCSEKPPTGYQIVSAQFALSGDRTCGAWSECKKSRESPDQTCYEFRLQGHSEWFPPHVAYSQGILKINFSR